MPPLSGSNLPSLILLVSAVVCLLMGMRAIQLGRRSRYFRHSRDRIVAGWWLIGGSLVLGVIGVLVYRSGEPFFALPQPIYTAAAEVTEDVVTSTATSRTFSTPFPTQTRPIPPSPTGAPVIPLSIDALMTGKVTPGPKAAITEIEFSPVLEGQLAQNPSDQWRNPIRQMYAVFKYSNMTPGAQWTVLWLRDGGLVHFETRPWDGAASGRSFSLWKPEQPYDLLPGAYEVQFFNGHQYLLSARFTLTGNPVKPTPTLTPRATRTPSFTPTQTWTPSITPSVTPTNTPRPTATDTAIPPSRTPLPTATATKPTNTPTITFTPSITPTPVYTALPTNTALYQKVTVYFVDSQRLAAGLIPPEVGVARYTNSAADPLPFLLEEFFDGPGDAESNRGLVVILNGFTGYSRVTNEGGVLSVYLQGKCEFTSLGYSIAQALIVNLKQFPNVQFVKIYDENGQTRTPSGQSDSAPACLGFSSLLDPTRTPTPAPIP